MPKQHDLPIEGPGIAPVRIKSVDELAEAYIKERDRRVRMTPREVTAKNELIDELHKHADKIGRDAEGVLRYEYDDIVIELRPGKETLKVRAADDNGEGE